MRHNLDVRVWLEGEEGRERRRGDQGRDKVPGHRRVLEPYTISMLDGEWRMATNPSACEQALMRVTVIAEM